MFYTIKLICENCKSVKTTGAHIFQANILKLITGFIAQLVEPRHINPEVSGSSPALVNFSLFIQIYLKMYPVSFPCGLLHDIYIEEI